MAEDCVRPEGYTIAKSEIPFTEIFDYKAQWVEWAGQTIAMERVPKGFPPGTADGPAPAYDTLPDKLCQCPHWGYMFKGKGRVRLADGTEYDINGGDLYYIPEGHLLWAVEDFENIEFNPAGPSLATVRKFREGIDKALKEKRIDKASDEGPVKGAASW